MSTVESHYENLLSRVYTWMAGGLAQKVEDNRRFFQEAGLVPRGGGKALDLGSGSGFQSLALAALGYNVVAVDTSESLLAELRTQVVDGRVTAVHGDMRNPTLYEPLGPFELVVCMGDTLVHLQSFDEVAACMTNVRRCMEPGGKMIVAFRDLTFELKGVDRAIPVRLDNERLMAAFLEYEPDHVVVHDMVFTRAGGKWEMRKSAYRKLRLAAARFSRLLEELGFQNVRQTTDRGFVTTIASLGS